jgi:hypothetical protein
MDGAGSGTQVDLILGRMGPMDMAALMLKSQIRGTTKESGCEIEGGSYGSDHAK